MLLGRQDAMKGLKAAQGGGEGLRAAYCLTLLSETRRKSPGKAPGRWPKDMLLGRQDAMKGLKAAQGAGEGLRAAYCLTLLSETRRKSPGKRPAGAKGHAASQGRHEGFKGSSGRRGGFKGSLLPNVAF